MGVKNFDRIQWNEEEEYIRIKDDLKVFNMKRIDIVIFSRRVVWEGNVDFEVKVEIFSRVFKRDQGWK